MTHATIIASTRTTAPAIEPVTVSEAKAAARWDGSELDPEVEGLITAARYVVEQETGRSLISQVWRHELADWPAVTESLPGYPATAVAISYWDGADWTTLAIEAYVWAQINTRVNVAPIYGTSWPALGAAALPARVRITITSGGASAAAVDEPAKTYIKALVAWWLRNPEAVAENGLQPSPYLARLLDSLKVY